MPRPIEPTWAIWGLQNRETENPPEESQRQDCQFTHSKSGLRSRIDAEFRRRSQSCIHCLRIPFATDVSSPCAAVVATVEPESYNLEWHARILGRQGNVYLLGNVVIERLQRSVK